MHYVTSRVALLRMMDMASVRRLGAIVIDEADVNVN
jgi:hypothetical protein